MIGEIIARFHLVYTKRIPEDASSNPAEEVPFRLWSEYLGKIILPDHKITAQQRSYIGFTLRVVVESLFHCGRKESLPRFLSILTAWYDMPEETDSDTAVTLFGAIEGVPSAEIDGNTLERLIRFGAYFAEHGDMRLRTASLLFLRQLQRPLEPGTEQMERIAEIAERIPDRGATIRFLCCSILSRAGKETDRETAVLLREDVASDVFLENLKTATPWLSKVVGIELLRTQAKQGTTDNILHICAHFSNLVKVSERVVARHAAGEALLDVLPRLSRDQRNEVVVELGKGLELGQYEISKYIPDYLGRAVLLLNPSELDEQVIWLRTLLGSPSDSTVHGALRTIGILLQYYRGYKDLFNEPGNRWAERRNELLGLILQGLAHYREAVRQEALLVVAQLFYGGVMDMEERGEIFTLCCRKLLFLLDRSPDQDSLTFFYRASALAHIERFLALYRLDHDAFRFERPARVAFFPGTFDPFTLSHKGIVRAIRERGFEVYLAVDEFSWSKKPQPHIIRRQIINMSVAGDFHVYLFPDDIPINIANAKDLGRLKTIFEGMDLYVVVGADVIRNASAYRKPPEPDSIHSMNHIVFTRPDQAPISSEETPHILGDLMELHLPSELEDISSSRIRENVDQNRDISHFVDPVIQDFIFQNGLYLRDLQEKPLLTASEIRFEWLIPPFAPRNGLDPLTGKLLADAESLGESALLIYHGNRCTGALTWTSFETSGLFSAMQDAALADRIRLRAAGRILLMEGISAEGEDAQMLLSEVMAKALADDCVWGVCRFRETPPEGTEDLLARQGFVRYEGTVPILEVDMHTPSVLIQNLETAIQEPLRSDPRVRAVISEGHMRVQRALTGLYPGSLLLTLSSDVVHQRLLERITEFNGVSAVPQTPAKLGPYMCVPFGKMLRGMILPNTVTKTIHTDKVYEPDLRTHTTEAFPFYPPIPFQVRTIKSFERPVVLVDDVMHPGNRIRILAPYLRREEIDVRMVLVGLLSGRGKDLMEEQNLPVDGAYFVPTLREWFVESTLYPFFGGDTVRRPKSPLPGLLPGINRIYPYMDPHFSGNCTRQSVFDLSEKCLLSALEVMGVLEQVYREQYYRNLTLSRLGEAVILPLCPDKGMCVHYDPNLAPSVYLKNELEQLMREGC